MTRYAATLRSFLGLLVLVTTLCAREDPTSEELDKKQKQLTEATERLKRAGRAREALEAATFLADELPESRPFLHGAVTRGAIVGRAAALKVLGERGEASADLEIISERLDDASPRVRLCAVLAIRRLGSEGFRALARYVTGEPVANNRKMAVKTFQLWNEPKGLDPVLEVLERETDPAVRRFCVAALHSLTRRDYGDDVEAWRDYQRALRLREEAREANGARRKR